MKKILFLGALMLANTASADTMILSCKDLISADQVSVILSANKLTISAGSEGITLQNQSPVDRTEKTRLYTNFGTQQVGEVDLNLIVDPNRTPKGRVKIYSDGNLEMNLVCKVSGFQG